MAASGSADPAADREVVVTRVYDAPARLLFEAWSKPEHIMKWFGPKGWPVTLCEMDFRVGGRWRFAMTGPSGVQNTPFGGEYHEIVPNRKIVFDNGFEEPGAGRMMMTVTFDEAADGRTTLTWRTLFPTVAMRDEYVGLGMEQGIASGFDQLTDVVRAMAGRG
ncbi:ATPase [Roseomonas hellenica]|uniref:ATPase n=1 Tax=Plastoroseomonas hellenica TaxID=2687306 RepID=A0ABS5F5B8_9PROT|nr:SRPBCC domain-containing protein [Plastoroseomonas hellenica]MBR0667658.1 ATPase [Plastoroseomonas hellenica]